MQCNCGLRYGVVQGNVGFILGVLKSNFDLNKCVDFNTMLCRVS